MHVIIEIPAHCTREWIFFQVNWTEDMRVCIHSKLPCLLRTWWARWDIWSTSLGCVHVCFAGTGAAAVKTMVASAGATRLGSEFRLWMTEKICAVKCIDWGWWVWIDEGFYNWGDLKETTGASARSECEPREWSYIGTLTCWRNVLNVEVVRDEQQCEPQKGSFRFQKSPALDYQYQNISLINLEGEDFVSDGCKHRYRKCSLSAKIIFSFCQPEWPKKFKTFNSVRFFISLFERPNWTHQTHIAVGN